MTAVHIITAEGDATAAIEAGAHGGDALVIRRTDGSVVMAMKAEHVSNAVLSTVMDPGTVATVRDAFGI